jgi:hypothetical protein
VDSIQRHSLLLRGHLFSDVLAGDLDAPVVLHTGTCRIQAAHDYVFLQSAKMVDLAVDAVSVSTRVVSRKLTTAEWRIRAARRRPSSPTM